MDNNKPAYKRVLLKLSGEALAGDKKFGIDFGTLENVCKVIKKCADTGVEIAIVVGGGNFWRGLKVEEGRMERSRADHMGMLATVMNAVAVADALEQAGANASVQTAFSMEVVADRYTRRGAEKQLSDGGIIVFGCGTGSPYFSTDTGAVLRAAEIGADVILLAKNIDAVYSADPQIDASAIKYDHIKYNDMLMQHLTVMDMTATSLAMENKIPVLLFALKDPENIYRAIMGEKIGTVID